MAGRLRSTADLPSDLLRDCSSRLGTAALVWGSGWFLVTFAYLVVGGTAGRSPFPGEAWPWPGVPVGAVVLLVSGWLFATRA